MFRILCVASTATNLDIRANVARLLQSVRVVEKISVKVSVTYPRCALIAMVPTLHQLKIAQTGRRRRRFNVSALRNAYPFRKSRQLVEAKMPSVITGGKTYVAAASTRRESKSVQCQTSLTWVFSDRPFRTTESNVRSSGGPGSVSTRT